MHAIAHSGGNNLAYLTADATAGVGSNSSAEARAASGVTAPSSSLGISAGLESVAFVTGNPTEPDVTTALAGNPLVQAAIAPAQVFALALQGGHHDATATSGHTYSSTVLIGVNVAAYEPSTSLLVGLLDTETVGTGFQTMEFKIYREGVLVLSETTLTLATAQAYFDDHVLDLGDIAVGVSLDNILDLRFEFELYSETPSSGFQSSFVVGVPEPSVAGLMGMGIAGFMMRRKRRQARA